MGRDKEKQAAYSKAKYLHRLSNGLCSRCGKPAIENRTYCLTCRQKQQQKTADRREKRIAAGICPCGQEPLEPNRRSGAKCRAKAKVKDTKIRDDRRALNQCIHCGDNVPMSDTQICKECSERYRSTSSNRRQHRRNKGLCPECGLLVDTDGVICSSCLQISKPRCRSRYYRLKENNKCVWCGDPLDTNSTKCNKCTVAQKHYSANKYKKRVKSQVCVVCCKPTPPGSRKCSYCNLVTNMRTRLYHALKDGGAVKQERTFDLVGCSVEELREHLESLFDENMTWDNYGDWHVDHLCPVSAYDLTDKEQRIRCFHYTNLRPMWGRLNCSKKDKVQLTPEELKKLGSILRSRTNGR